MGLGPPVRDEIIFAETASIKDGEDARIPDAAF